MSGTTEVRRAARVLAEQASRLAAVMTRHPDGWQEPATALFGRPGSSEVESAADLARQAGLWIAWLVFSAPRCTARPDSLADGFAEPLWKGLEADASIRQSLRALDEATGTLDRETVWRELLTDGAVDPAASLFEWLLSASAPRQRRDRGVYYTPRCLVGYLLRSVDHLLCERFFADGGLHAERASGRELQIVDPACGSGNFLLALPGMNAERASRWRGYEVLPAAAAVAELLLRQHSGLPRNAPRIVQPANPLRAPSDLTNTTSPSLPVIVGNPPYANFGRRNRFDWILGLLEDYKRDLDERKSNLNDDFIKFIRWSQFQVEQAGAGIVALVTNRTYLAGLTHRVMRESLQAAFDELFILDLHGDSKRASAGDENVFPIQQGVALTILVRRSSRPAGMVQYAEMRGSRADKIARLGNESIATTPWDRLACRPPSRFFVPSAKRSSEYLAWPRLDEIFEQYISGVQSKRDRLFVGLSREQVAEQIQRFLHESRTLADDPSDPLVRKARGVTFDERCIRPYLIAPLDSRWIYYEPRLLGRSRYSVMQHMLRPNLGLLFMRQSANAGPYDQVLATRSLASDRVLYSARGAPFLAPLCRYDADRAVSNLQSRFKTSALQQWGGSLASDSSDAPTGLPDSADTELFAYVYGILHCPHYRRRFADSLRTDFPRIPLLPDRGSAIRVASLGRRLMNLHTQSGACGQPLREDDTNLVASGTPRFLHTQQGTWLELGGATRLGPLPKEASQMTIGGYPVLRRWLKQRRACMLDAQHISECLRLAQVLSHTGQCMAALDEVVRPAVDW